MGEKSYLPCIPLDPTFCLASRQSISIPFPCQISYLYSVFVLLINSFVVLKSHLNKKYYLTHLSDSGSLITSIFKTFF